MPSQFEKLLTLICLRLSYLGWWRLHWKDLSHISVCASTYTDHPHHRESDGPVCTSVWCHELLAEKDGKKAFRFASNRSTLISSGSNGPKIKKAQTYSFFFTLSGLGQNNPFLLWINQCLIRKPLGGPDFRWFVFLIDVRLGPFKSHRKTIPRIHKSPSHRSQVHLLLGICMTASLLLHICIYIY